LSIVFSYATGARVRTTVGAVGSGLVAHAASTAHAATTARAGAADGRRASAGRAIDPGTGDVTAPRLSQRPRRAGTP